MVIGNIHILSERGDEKSSTDLVQAHLVEQRLIEHRRGDHIWGSMKRDCPLCQDGR